MTRLLTKTLKHFYLLSLAKVIQVIAYVKELYYLTFADFVGFMIWSVVMIGAFFFFLFLFVILTI